MGSSRESGPHKPRSACLPPTDPHRYSINAMGGGTVEEEPEVRTWLEALPSAEFGYVAFYIDLLRDQGPLLGEPYTKQLDGKLRELRFYLSTRATRIAYWIASGRRIVLLTVFVKTRDQERREIARAKKALEACRTEWHTADDEEG